MNEKVIFVYKEEGSNEYGVESLWCTKQEEYYCVDNIPFYAKNIAINDIIKVEYDESDGKLYFEDIIKTSGNSVIRVLVKEKKDIKQLGELIETWACNWESFDERCLMSIDVPKDVNYKLVLSKIRDNPLIIDYQEACIGWK